MDDELRKAVQEVALIQWSIEDVREDLKLDPRDAEANQRLGRFEFEITIAERQMRVAFFKQLDLWQRQQAKKRSK